MRIAYLVSDLGLISETFISDLVEGLAETQTVTVLCNNLAGKPRTKHCTVKQVGFLSLTSIFDRFQYRINAMLSQRGADRNYQIRLNHAHRTLVAALKQHQPDVAYIDYGSVAVLARAALKTLKIPFVVHFHGADITSALNDDRYRKELAHLLKDASALVVASHHIKRLLVLEGAPTNKIHMVRYGVNLEEITPLSWDERKQHPPGVVFLGRFTPKKHPIALVEAFSLVKQQVPDARLSMIGDGPEMSRVLQRIQHLNLQDSVKLYGSLPRSEALPIVNSHWVFAQHSVTAPSGDQEGFGISLAEAAALGLPVVSTLHNGIPEQVIHGKTGFLVREFDYETMSNYMVKLLLSVDLATEIGKSGYSHIHSLCIPNQRIKEIEKILLKLLKETRGYA